MSTTSDEYIRQTDRISDRIMRWNLWVIAALVAVNALAAYFLTDNTVLATISSVLGMVIKSFLDERKEVTGFYFGSSVGSKIKEQSNG